MGLLEKGFRPKAARELSYYSPAHDHWYKGMEFFGMNPTSAGISVNSDTAMRLITVNNCVRMRASTLSRLPCHLMTIVSKKDKIYKNKATDFYLYNILRHQPNPWMSASEFWKMAEAHVCLRGNFYCYKLGIDNRPIRALIPIGPDRVQKIEQNDDYTLTYYVRLGGKYNGNPYMPSTYSGSEVVPIPGFRIMHLRGLTLDGITGLNPIEYARESIGLGMASTKFLARWFGSGMHPSAVIEHPLPLNSPVHAKLRKNLEEKYKGLGKSHELMLIDEGMKIQFPQFKLVDAQYLEQMKLSEAQICGMFRVPLMLVNGGDKSPTYASAEQFMLFYQMFSIDVFDYESAIRRDLLTPKEQDKYYAKFNLRSLQRGSFKEQMEGFGTGIDKEFFNPDEVREWLDMNPYEGGEIYKTRTSTTKETVVKEQGASK